MAIDSPVKKPFVGYDKVVLTYAELKELGAEKAWLMIQQADSSACIHRLLALEGAILGIKKTLIPGERKKELKEFYMAHKARK